MTAVFKATGPASFLGLVPALLGFTPTQSVVAIPFGGSPQRTLGAMRVDMPAPGSDLARFAGQVLDVIARVPDAHSVAIIAYADVSAERAREVVGAVHDLAYLRELSVVDALYVTPGGWGGLSTNLALNPLIEIPVHEGAPSPEGTQNSQCVLPTPTRDQVRAFEEAHTSDERTLWLDSMNNVANDPLPLTGSLAAALSLTCARPAVRDVMLLTVLGGIDLGEQAVDAQLAWDHGAEYPEALASRLWGAGDQPDPDRLKRMQDHLALTAALDGRAGTLATLAWVCWALGQSTTADCHAKAALAIDPEHGLAEIVRSFVDAGHLPAWAFKKQAS